MLKDVTEMGETPYFIYTTTSAKNLLAYMICSYMFALICS